jgi:ribose-phosphate pyrophosphokinase
MSLTVFAGSANQPLAEAVAARLGVSLGQRELCRFPDGELHVALQESVRGHDVYLLQPTNPPAEAHLLELLLLADACRRAGASQLTAVIPYFGYARQDRRAGGREAVGARLMVDLLAVSGIGRVVAVDLHTTGLEAVFGIPLEHLTAVPLLAEAIRSRVPTNGVIVAPDLGAAKLADRYARLLHLPVAIVHKTRLTGRDVKAHGLTGNVRDRAPLVVDDMISTAGTMEAAIQTVCTAGCVPEVTAVASHSLLVGPAAERLRAAPVQRLVTTDSALPTDGHGLPLQVVSLAPLLAEAIQRLHRGESLSELIRHE